MQRQWRNFIPGALRQDIIEAPQPIRNGPPAAEPCSRITIADLQILLFRPRGLKLFINTEIEYVLNHSMQDIQNRESHCFKYVLTI